MLPLTPRTHNLEHRGGVEPPLLVLQTSLTTVVNTALNMAVGEVLAPSSPAFQAGASLSQLPHEKLAGRESNPTTA